jgi:hypothetical protein
MALVAIRRSTIATTPRLRARELIIEESLSVRASERWIV